MVQAAWGTKRTCPKCSTRFYDLGNDDPVVCIACETSWIPEPVLKSKQPLPFEAAQPEKEKETDEDLGAEDESLIVEDYDRPVFVMNYPKEAKAFYMKENPADPRTVLCDDLLAPEGYGEIIGGSQREDDHDKLLARIKEEGLPLDAYGWYLDLRKYGTFVHSGFGLGLERTVAWICGTPHIRETSAFPRLMNRLRP